MRKKVAKKLRKMANAISLGNPTKAKAIYKNMKSVHAEIKNKK